MGGVFNELRINENAEYRQSVLDFLLTASFEEVKNASKSGLNLAVPIKGVPVTLGADFDKDKLQKWQMMHQSLKSTNTSSKKSYELMLKWASKDILDAWTKCMASCGSKQGFTARIVAVQDDSFTVALSWIPAPGDEGKPKVKDSVLIGCSLINAKQLSDTLVLETGIDTHTIAFTRPANSDSVIVINTSKGSVTLVIRGKQIACPDCHGTGKIACTKCAGSGFSKRPETGPVGGIKPPDFLRDRCKQCDGKGFSSCKTCEGKGISKPQQ